MRSLQATASEYREKPMLWAGRLGEFNQLLKARAAAACRAVPELTKALRNDGGIAPPAADKAEGESEGEALPPTPFDSTETDDSTHVRPPGADSPSRPLLGCHSCTK